MRQRILRNSAWLLAVFALTACAHRVVRPAEPASQKQDYVIEARPSVVAPGEPVNLHWSIPGATKVSIDASGSRQSELQHLGTFGGSGDLEVKPIEDTMYVVSCEGSRSVSCASVSVKVRVKP